MKILVVDDMKTVHAYLRQLLAPFPQFELVDVFDGEEALSLLERGANFDLILLDWEMPKMNGPATISELKSRHVPTPVMVMSTKNLPEDISEMLSRGAVDYLMKPFTADILLAKIEALFGGERAHAG